MSGAESDPAVRMVRDAERRQVIVPCPGCRKAAMLDHRRPAPCACGCQADWDGRVGADVLCLHCCRQWRAYRSQTGQARRVWEVVRRVRCD